MNSLNQPWAISSKKRQRFGNTWADIDFEFNQLSEKNFEDEPYLTVVGTLSVANQRLQVNLKDLNGFINGKIEGMVHLSNVPSSKSQNQIGVEELILNWVLISTMVQLRTKSRRTLHHGEIEGTFERCKIF